MTLSHIDLATYYQYVYILAKKMPFTLTEIEDMMPFERDLFFEILVEETKEKNKQEEL